MHKMLLAATGCTQQAGGRGGGDRGPLGGRRGEGKALRAKRSTNTHPSPPKEACCEQKLTLGFFTILRWCLRTQHFSFLLHLW